MKSEPMGGSEGEENKSESLERLFLREKPAKLLISIKTPKYATQLSKMVDCTYSHTVKLLDIFKALGLVQFEKTGRIKTIRLTPDGEEIAHYLEGLIRKFDHLEGTRKKNEDNQQK